MKMVADTFSVAACKHRLGGLLKFYHRQAA
jgi:hypothetical protein